MKKLMKGNDAVCEAAIRAGCKAFFGYPITPQNEIPEYMSIHMEPAGGCFIQAESEIAAINMVYGAACTGNRVMTSSSSPGMALKQEGISYLVGADLPCVIVSVARCGPGLGGILPSQADYFQTVKGGGNGDYFTPVYAPSTIQEAADLTQKAFDIAEKYRTPVLVLFDGALGQMMEPVEIVDAVPQPFDTKWVTDGNADKRGRNIVTSLNLTGPGLEGENIERFERYAKIKQEETMVQSTVADGDELAIVAYGMAARVAQSAVDMLKAQGVKAGLVRPITLWPFPDETLQALPKSVKNVLTVEMSMGQMVDDVKIAVNGRVPVHFFGRTGGVVMTPEEIVEAALKIGKGGA